MTLFPERYEKNDFQLKMETKQQFFFGTFLEYSERAIPNISNATH